MNTRQIAKALGRRGGRARAARLSPAECRRIASLGGHARRRSLEAARRVAENFAYAAAVDAIQGTPTVKRVATCKGPLPGLHERKS